MSEAIKVFRVLALPTTPVPKAFYYVKNGNKAEAYMTDMQGNYLALTNTDAILALIGNMSAGPVEAYDPGDVTLMFDNALL